MTLDTEHLQRELHAFSAARGWGRHHNPKSLVMALSVEVAELMEHFQWLTDEESFHPVSKEGVREEVADVLIYLLHLADRLDIDLDQAVRHKIQLNSLKYPAEGSNDMIGEHELQLG